MADEWNTTVPVDHTLISDLPNEHRKGKTNTKVVIEKEHRTLGDGNSGGEHQQGSAISYFLPTASAPTQRPDASTALTIEDAGRLWFDTTTKQLKVLESVGPIVWVVLPETTQANTWAAVQTFSVAPVFPAAGNGLTPVGGIMEFAGTSAPTGWLLCDGTTGLSTTANPEYTALFGVIGTTYGGAGAADFDLPDMKGRVPVGVGTGDASDATSHSLAEKEGTEGVTLTAAQSGLPAHNHTAAVQFKNPESSPNKFSGCNTAAGTGTASTNNNTAANASDAHNNLQPSLTLNFIIKY